ncbi:MAG: Na+/H+ antiporter subunit E [Halobacteriaceae archaeon]
MSERPARGVPRWPVIGLALALLWLFVRGIPLDARVLASELVFGSAVGLPTAFVFRRLYADRIDLVRVVRVLPFAGIYLATFLWELATANIDVAYRVLAPSMPIEPRVIEIPLRVESDAAVTTIANSITLTPGTLTMDHDEERNSLYVHAIDGRDREAVVAPIRRWEGLALLIFAEDRNPDDPVPDPDGGETDGE